MSEINVLENEMKPATARHCASKCSVSSAALSNVDGLPTSPGGPGFSLSRAAVPKWVKLCQIAQWICNMEERIEEQLCSLDGHTGVSSGCTSISG